MNDAEEKLHREVALFRYGLIADLVHLPPGTPGIGDELRAKAEHQYTIPGTLRTRVAAETLRDWLLHYRRGGADYLALVPTARPSQPVTWILVRHPLTFFRMVPDYLAAGQILPHKNETARQPPLPSRPVPCLATPRLPKMSCSRRQCQSGGSALVHQVETGRGPSATNLSCQADGRSDIARRPS